MPYSAISSSILLSYIYFEDCIVDHKLTFVVNAIFPNLFKFFLSSSLIAAIKLLYLSLKLLSLEIFKLNKDKNSIILF